MGLPEGWTRTNGWGQMQSGDWGTAYYNQPGSLKYGENGFAYSMPLQADTYYELSFKHRSHDAQGGAVKASVLCGEDGLAETIFPKNSSTTDWATETVKFKTGADAGNYVLTLANSGNTWMTDVQIFTTTLETAKVTMGATGFLSYVTTFSVDFTKVEDLKGYIITAEGVTPERITYTEIESVPSGTAVMLKGNGSTSYTLTETLDKTADVSANVYKPGERLVSEEEFGTIWAFNKNGKWGRVKPGVTVPANKGYLIISGATTAEINAYVPGDEPIVDAINGIVDETAAPEGIYNLQGQKVEKATKGIYIINGKKTLVK